ncbi:MAG: hypothetical protein FJW37_03395 [Acidobacteria bacterium]|nr:hypothetical protein [Acidobacteriota bacterium]
MLFLAAAALAQLAIVNAGVQQTEDGSLVTPGVAFVGGETLFLSFQVEGYRVSRESKLRISYQVDALDPEGVKLLETIESNLDRDLAPQDKEWKPKVRHQIPIPPHAPSGAYRVAIRVQDDLAAPKTTAAKEVPFTVRGHEVSPSETLVIRNFGFYRSEEDHVFISPPAYRPGDALFARFDITGYKLGGANQVRVDYGIEVLDPGGKVLYRVEEAAVETSSSFYPKRYVPGTLRLDLQPKIRPGEFTIVLTVRDRIGNQQIEHRQRFSIEQ